MTRERARIFSIAPGVPFLPELAAALLDGRLIGGFPDSADPLSLASAAIYVPTRRAARELRAAFASHAGHGSVLLPQIRPLGEFDDDALFAPDAAAGLAEPIGAIERQLLLARLVRSWKGALPGLAAEKSGEAVTVPASAADAIWMARELAAFMDEAETAQAPFSRLGSLAEGDLAGWWQVTLEFLSIVTEKWPAVLAAAGRSSPAAFRNAAFAAETARLDGGKKDGPVIVAGSTGSIPATAKLIARIARLPDGCVVLPGLDFGMDDRAWASLLDERHPAHGHPQYGLARLLAAMGAMRSDVENLGAPEAGLAARAALISAALRPAEMTDGWAAMRGEMQTAAHAGTASADAQAPDFEARIPSAPPLKGEGDPPALVGVTLLEAASEGEEALAIAIALRRALADPGKSAALVTPDRTLARRVASELQRFGIMADDSGGTPLAMTPAAVFLARIAEAAFKPGDPLAILDVIKNPFLRLGRTEAEAAQAAEVIELAVLRGGAGRPDAMRLAALMAARRAARANSRHQPGWAGRFTEDDFGLAARFCADFDAALAPLAALRKARAAELQTLLKAAVTAMETLAADADGGLGALYAGDSGEALANLLKGLLAANASFELSPQEWPDVLAALTSGEIVKPAAGASARLHIWGTLEARLQSVDLLVLGGLNEGKWPARTEPGQFLSRVMRSEMQMEPPERRTGQAAHDFQMGCGQAGIVLSRAVRSGDAPAAASRWLQRLEAFCGEDALIAARARGGLLIAAARGLDRTARTPPAARPCHAPPLSARPRRFSVTEIEMLRRDPYAVYARRVLRLKPAEPLISDPGAAERGTMIHEIARRFTEAGPPAGTAEGVFLDIGRAVFDEAELPQDVDAVWWPRFVRLAPGFVRWDLERRASVSSSLTEAESAKLAIGATGVTLSGRADRIDLLSGGRADILDYKTGATPSRQQAHTLVAPQLALEAALLARGAFGEAREPHELAHVRLTPKGEVIEESILQSGKDKFAKTGPQIAQEAWERLERLIESFADAQKGYLSRLLPFRENETDGDYDHLARVLEWSAGGDGKAEAEDEA